MKKLILNILLIILLLTTATANTSWVNISADNGISYLSEDPNIPEPEVIGSLIDCLDEDPNEPVPEPECI